MFGGIALLCTMNLNIEGLWNQDLTSVSALVSSGGAIYLAAMGILSVVLLYGIYDAFMHGGGMREVVLIMVKVSVCAFLIQNWYSFFNDITANGSFSIANHIGSQNFYQDLYSNYIAKYVQSSDQKYALYKLLFADPLVLAQNLLFSIATAVFWIGYYFIAVIFTMFGLVLFALGPLVIALYPNSIFGSMAKSYLKGVIQWLTWPIIYTIIGLIMNQLFATYFSMTNLVGGPTKDVTLGGAATNVAIMAVLGISMFTVPWIAHHVVAASFAGAAAVVGKAVGSAAGAAVGVAAGGLGALSGGGAGAAAGGSKAGAAGAGASAGSPGGGGASAGGPGSVGPPPASPPPSQSGGGAQPSSSSASSGSGSAAPPAASPQAQTSSPSGGSQGSAGTATASAPAPSPGSGGKNHWDWKGAFAGGAIGYRQGVGGVAGVWAKNQLRGTGSSGSPSAPPAASPSSSGTTHHRPRPKQNPSPPAATTTP